MAVKAPIAVQAAEPAATPEEIPVPSSREAALREQASLLESLTFHLAHSPLACIAWNQDLEVQSWSPTATTLFGWSAPEVMGKTLGGWRFFCEEDLPAVARMTDALLDGHHPHVSTLCRNYTKDGEVRWCQWHCTARLDADGRLESLLSLVEDVTAQEKARRQMAESEARFKSLVTNSPAAIMLHDGETIFYANIATLKLLGASRPEQVVGRPLLDFVHPDHHDTVRQRIKDLWSGEISVPLAPQRYLGVDGQTVEVEAAGQAFDFGNQRLIYSVVQDVSLRHALETRMQQFQKLETLGLVAGGVAHDFNNLLAGIMGYAELALLELEPGSKLQQNLEQIARISRRASELTGQMLAYSGKGRTVKEPLDLSALVREMTSLLHATLPPRLEIQLELADNLPPVMADSGQVNQVFMNLVTNAAEAIGDQPGLIKISTGLMYCDRAYLQDTFLYESQSDDLYAWLEVTDNGLGMDPAMVKKIFDPFFTTKFTGRGLGLAATLGIVRSHRGAIKIASQPGQGSTFRLLLPVGPRRAALPPVPRSVPEYGLVGAILVVDDEEYLLEVARQRLERVGMQVFTACGGQEALDKFSRHLGEIDVVVLDLSMPDLPGSEVLAQLRGMSPRIPVILTSGYNQEEINKRFGPQEAEGFLQKPYTTRSLLQKLREVLGQEEAKE
ncbi:MAG: PAS domain S-box protein [Deltaproteobacteria bacterium]|nr:PAS domain S-box protein [Deltaproteobacteria bacterium]